MEPGLLTNRELAALVVLAALFLLITAAPRRAGPIKSIRFALRAVWRSFMSVRVPTAYVLYFLAISAAVSLAARWDLWTRDLWKDTILWWLFSGAGLFGKLATAATRKGVFVDILKRLVAAGAVFHLVANLISFPLWVEIPAMVVAVATTIRASQLTDEAQHSRAARLAKLVFALYAISAVIWAVWRVWSDWEEINRDLLMRELLLPLWLTPVALLLAYPLVLLAALEVVTDAIALTANRRPTPAQRLAVLLRCAGRLNKIRQLQPAAHRLAQTKTFKSTWAEVAAIHKELRNHRRGDTVPSQS